MPPPGPPAESLSVLEKRGAGLAVTKRNRLKRAAKSQELSGRIDRQTPRPIGSLERIISTKIPGYDPHRGAKDYEFYEPEARAAVEFFHTKLTHAKGPKFGQLFALEEWQQAIIANLFGWHHKETGLKRYRECLCYVPRGNGKTAMAAGIVLLGLFNYGDDGSEIYGAASEYKQASLVFSHARMMVLKNPELKADCSLFAGQAKSIQRGEDVGFSTYRVMSSASDAAHGFNTSLAVIDELHTQPNSNLVDAIGTSMGKREESLLIHITTADFDREGSVCNAKHRYGISVRDGIIDDPTFLPVIYEAEDGDDWKDENVWIKANPNLGVSHFMDHLRREKKKAENDPTYENTFRRFYLNQKTQQAHRIIPMEKWDSCAGIVNYNDLKGRACFMGLDLSTTSDITAGVYVFPGGDAPWDVFCRFWIPKDNAELRQTRDRVPYLTWAKDGLVTLTDGDDVDQRFVRHQINEDAKHFHINQIAFDPFNAAKISGELQDEDGFNLIQYRQGMLSMAGPTKELLRMIRGQQINHGGNPVLRWMASNVTGREDHLENMMPDKKKSFEKIDGVVSLIMAIGLATKARRSDGNSVYDNEAERPDGLLII